MIYLLMVSRMGEGRRKKDDSKASSLHHLEDRDVIICEECVFNESSENQG